MEVKYLSNTEINRDLWDQCIEESHNSLIYGYSWYLDSLADNWDGIVIGEYEAVFPLTHRSKKGIHYLYQPFFTQQLGLFSKEEESVALDKVLDVIPKKFKYWDIQLNGSYQSNKYELKDRITFHIDLKDSYESIKGRYNKDATKNIRKANAEHWKLRTSTNFEIAIQDYKEAYGNLNQNILEKDYLNLNKVLNKCKEDNMALFYILENEVGERMGSAIFLKSKNAIHYILGAPTVKGRNLNATHVLIDKVLQEQSSSNLIFDFEGSEIPSVASFYKKFGVLAHTYYGLKVNRLPFPLNLFKK